MQLFFQQRWGCAVAILFFCVREQRQTFLMWLSQWSSVAWGSLL
jgi:hypothetical protein